mmetsp:Transcript_14385/g.22164  ORF Transcript_14385/g.22164 Transcript_14385/m.22164 type:complete len:84 (+) Transcript_14385:476-727(+)
MQQWVEPGNMLQPRKQDSWIMRACDKVTEVDFSVFNKASRQNIDSKKTSHCFNCWHYERLHYKYLTFLFKRNDKWRWSAMTSK